MRVGEDCEEEAGPEIEENAMGCLSPGVGAVSGTVTAADTALLDELVTLF